MRASAWKTPWKQPPTPTKEDNKGGAAAVAAAAAPKPARTRGAKGAPVSSQGRGKGARQPQPSAKGRHPAAQQARKQQAKQASKDQPQQTTPKAGGLRTILGYGDKEYWDGRYEHSPIKFFDWYLSYGEFRYNVLESLGMTGKKENEEDEENSKFRQFHHRKMHRRRLNAMGGGENKDEKKKKEESEEKPPEEIPCEAFSERKGEMKILNVGCGNSELARQLFRDGFQNSLNVDVSNVVIKQMKSLHEDMPGVQFETMDAMEMKLPPQSFDVIFDKGTLDSILCGPDPARRAGRMLVNIHKALQPGGIFFLVSYAPPKTRLKYINNRRFSWTVENTRIGGGYLYIMKKKNAS